MDQPLEASPDASNARPKVFAKDEIRVILASDQLCPPIGAEVCLNRADGRRIPCVLTRIEEAPVTRERILVFVIQTTLGDKSP